MNTQWAVHMRTNELRAMAKFASKNTPTRSHLCCVHISKDCIGSEEVEVVATNGHVMGILSIPKDSLENTEAIPNKGVNIPLVNIPTKSGINDHIEIRGDAAKPKHINLIESGMARIDCPIHDEEFPEYGRVFPKPAPKKEQSIPRVNISSNVLEVIIAAMKLLGKKDACLAFDFMAGQNNQILIQDLTINNLVVVAMPMKDTKQR